MATASDDLDGTPAYVFKMVVRFVVGFPLFAGVATLMSAPALVALGTVYPEGQAFGWLVVFAYTIITLDRLGDDDAPTVSGYADKYEEMTPAEIIAFLLSVVLMSVGIMSAIVASYGTLGALITTASPAPAIVGVVVAAAGSFVDLAVARRTGYSIGVAGLLLGFGIFYAFVVVQELDTAMAVEVRKGFENGLYGARSSRIGR